jgi:hypothetical protein
MRYAALFTFVMIVVGGCATTNPISTPPYYPSNPSAVLLKHQGEILASASASTGGETFSAAYALTQHLGLLANGSFTLHKSGDPNGNQYSGELGIGLFDTAASGHIEHEIYGGFGWGTGHNYQESIFPGYPPDSIPARVQETNTEQMHFWNAWLQVDGGYAGTYGSFMFITRFSFVDIYHDLLQESQWNWDPFFGGPGYDNYSSERSFRLFFVTPGLEARIGLEHIQLVASVLQFIGLDGVNSNTPPLIESIGITYKF